MANEISIFTSGKVLLNGREFTRLIGGFGENKPTFTLWQAGELLNTRTAKIIENFERNEFNFQEGLDFIDMKSAILSKDSDTTIDITSVLIDCNISQNRLNATKRWLAFSYSGMMKLVKISESEESWNAYDNFLEDYFKTKAENVVMTKTLEQQIEFLEEQRCTILGKMFICKDPDKKMEYFQQNEDYAEQIKQIELTLAKENIIEQLQPKLNIADRLTNSDSCFDMNAFAKAVRIKGLGRNNMFEWLREQGILRPNNEPYDRYMDYFKVIYNPNPYNNKINVKTLVRPKGISYIFKKLIKDGKMIMKSIDEVLSELEPEAIN